jgi:pyruvate formate lyase activating enzyme
MRIKGFIDTSFVDWDGKIVSTVFVPRCNFRCPFCFNHGLILHPERYPDIPASVITGFMGRNRDFLDGVCITGGEPTLAGDLEDFCRSAISLGMKVKLDTNGSRPNVLKKLLADGLVHYVAMDIKAPPDDRSYSRAIGVRSAGILDAVMKSVSLLMGSGTDYEFRTTVVPSLHSQGDIQEIAQWIQGARSYVLQKFRPENAWRRCLRELPAQKDSEMEGLVSLAAKYVRNVKWRGR